MSARKLKLLFVGPKTPYPANDGGRIAMLEPMRHLAARGHEVAYLGFGRKEEADALKGEAELAWARAVQHDTRTHLGSLAAALLTRAPYTAGKYRSPEMSRALSFALAEEHFDLVQLEQTHMAWYIPDIQRAKGVSVLRLQNIESELMLSFARQARPPVSWYASLQARRMRAFETQACRDADACLAITEMDAEWVSRNAHETMVLVVPAGSAVRRLANSEQRAGLCILFIGALDWQPNAQGVRWFAKRIWPVVKSGVPSAQCVVIGRNPPDDIRMWARAEPKVEVLGFVEDIEELRSRADVEIVPILSGGGMRVKILDAFAHGNAVVSTSLGAMGIAATNEKEILLADTEADFARQVVRLLLHPDLRRKIGDSALNLVARSYSWERVVTQQEEAYYHVLSAKAGEPET